MSLSITARRVRMVREAMNMSRPGFADLLQCPPTTLKNYELGYREVGGQFLINMGKILGANTVLYVMDVKNLESNLEQHIDRVRDNLAAKGVTVKYKARAAA